MLTFIFTRLTIAQLPLLFAWLGLPHVSAWWRETRDYEKFAEKYAAYIISTDVGPYVIYDGSKPIGYISWADMSTCPIHGGSFPAGTYGIDLFIADTEYMGKGHGHVIIKQFINDIIMPLHPTKIITDPESTNTRSIHVFQKAGFVKTKIITGTDGTQSVLAQLMELDL